MARLGDTYGGGGEYFKGKESVADDPILTIKSVREKVWKEGENPQWVVAFNESEMEFGLNWTNVVSVADLCCPGKEINDVEFSDIIGHQIQLFWNRTVMYGTKMTGGIRIRKPSMSKSTVDEPTWGLLSASKFTEFMIGRIQDCTKDNVDLVVSEIASRIGVSGDVQDWPVSVKPRAMAAANTVAKEIAEGELDLATMDESEIPF